VLNVADLIGFNNFLQMLLASGAWDHHTVFSKKICFVFEAFFAGKLQIAVCHCMLGLRAHVHV
jgi:hypothetical protein